MVAIRGQVLGANPATGLDGVWWQRTGDPANTWVGMAKTDMQALPTGSGSAAQRRTTFIANLLAALQSALGPGYVLTLGVSAAAPFSLDDIAIRDA